MSHRPPPVGGEGRGGGGGGVIGVGGGLRGRTGEGSTAEVNLEITTLLSINERVPVLRRGWGEMYRV